MRVGLFIDTHNLYINITKVFNRKVDYEKLVAKVIAITGHPTTSKIAFGVRMKDEAKGFINSLKVLGFDTKFILRQSPKTNLNVDIAVDVIRKSEKLDVVVLCTADRDILPLVNYLKDLGIKVYLLACDIPKELSLTVQSVEISTSELEGEDKANEITKIEV